MRDGCLYKGKMEYIVMDGLGGWNRRTKWGKGREYEEGQLKLTAI